MSTSIKEQFESLEWHDANLLAIYIDRSDPGNKDEVLLKIQWPDETIQSMRFVDCYDFEATMNFGIVACESIFFAYCLTDSPLLEKRWKTAAHYGIELKDLLCFEITMNTTASVIRITARAFELAVST